MESTLAVDILLAIYFIHLFIRDMISVKRKVVFWHSQPVAILSAKAKRRDSLAISILKEKPSRQTPEPAKDENHGHCRVARKKGLKPFTQNPF